MVMMLGEAKGVITLDVTDLSAKTAQATSTLGKLESAAGSGFGKLDSQLQSVGMTTDQLGKGMIGFGLAMGAPIALGVAAAANLEQAFVNVETALGDVSATDFSKLQTAIIDIGANGQYSATEIAAVSEELAKAGRTVEEQLGGNMLKAVSDLSSATGTDLMTSVSGINSVMAIWSEETVGAALAMTDASVVADAFTYAANNSNASVEDIMMGMRNLGPIAATMGVGFEEAAATISVFSNNGIKASVAGTALNTAITRLANPTSEASLLMEQLGIDAFDAQGKFIGFPAMFDNLATAMKGQTMEQKAQALATIFGLEAMDAMALAALNGGDAIRELTLSQKDYGIASQQAEDRTKTLLGAWERLTEGITVALALMAGGLVGPLTVMANAVDAVIAVISKVPAPILQAVGTVMALVAAFSIAGGTAILMAPRIMAFVTTVRALAATQGPLTGVAQGLLTAAKAARIFALALTGIGLVAGAVFLAYKSNFLGFADWVNGTFGDLIDFVRGANDDFTSQNQEVTKSFNGMVETVHNADGTTSWFYTELDDNGTAVRMGEIIESKEDLDGDNKVEVKIKTEDGEYWTWIDLNTGEIVGESSVQVKAEPEPSSWDKLQTRLERLKDAWAAKGWTIPAAAVGGIQKMVKGIQNASEYASDFLKRISLFGSLFNALRDSGQGFFEAMSNSLQRVFYKEIGFIKKVPGQVRKALQAIPKIAQNVFAAGASIARWALDVAVPTVTGWIKTAGTTAWDALTDAAGWAWDKGTDIANWTLDVAAPKVAGWLKSAGETAWEGLSSAAGWATGKVIDLKDWTMDVAKPTVSGWISSIGDTAMDFLAGAAGFAADVVELADWALDVAAPKLSGWISGAGDTLWSLLQSAVGLVGGAAAELGAWTLDTAVPTVTGWITGIVDDVWGVLQDAAGIIDLPDAEIPDWTLDVPEPGEVVGWIQDFADDPAQELMDLVLGEDGKLEITLDDWTLKIDEPNVNKWLDDFDAWFLEEFGMSPGQALVTMRDWVLDVGAPKTIEVTQNLSVLIADFIGGIGVTLGNVLLSVMFSREFKVLGWDVDEILENAFGYLGERGIDVFVDIAWNFVRDPLDSLKRIFALTFLAGLVLSVAVVGFTATILPLALIALGITIVNQLRDYFAENPQKLDELKIEIGSMWAELEGGQFGMLFTALRKIGEAALWTANAAKEIDSWLMGLPGPLSDAYGWVRKLTIALIALQAVSLMGGFTPGKTGKGSKGFLGGLLSGLWMLAAFPFKLAFNPLKTLRNLFAKKPGGAGGGAQNWLVRGSKLLWAIAAAPFRIIGNGFKAIASGWKAFSTGFDRGLKMLTKTQILMNPFRAFFLTVGRGISGLWKHMSGAKNVVGSFLRAINGVAKAVNWLIIKPFQGIMGALNKLVFSKLGIRIGTALRSALTIGANMFLKAFNGFFRGASKAFIDGMKALFSSKFGIISSPKAFAAFNMLSNIFTKLRGVMARLLGPVSKLFPFFARLAPLGRLLASPFALLARGALMLVPALAAIPVVGWIILGVIALLVAAFIAWKTNFLGFRDAVSAGWGKIVSAFEKIKEVWDTLKDAFERGGWSEVWDTLVNMFEAIDWLDLGATLLKGAAIAIGVLILGIPGLLIGLSLLIFNALTDIDWGGIGSAIWSGLSGAVGWVKDQLVGLASGFWDWLQDLDVDWSAIGNALLTGLDIALQMLLGVDLSTLVEWGRKLVDWIKDGVIAGWTTLNTWLGGLPGRIVSAIGGFAGGLAGLISKGREILDSIKTGAINGWTTLSTWLGGLPGRIVGAIGEFVDLSGLMAKGRAILDNIKQGAIDGWTTLNAWLGGIPGRIIGAIGDFGLGDLIARGREVIDSIKEGAIDGWTTLKHWFSGLPGRIVDSITIKSVSFLAAGLAILQGIYDGVNNFWNDTLHPWFSNLMTNITTAIGDIDFSFITDAIDDLGTAASNAGGFLGDLASGIGKVAEKIGALVSAGWDKLPDWLTGGDDGPSAEQMQELARAIEEAETRITDALDGINTAFLEFDDTVVVDGIDAKLSTAFIANDATVLGTSISNWVKRGLSKMQELVATEQVGLRAARAIDADFKTGFAGLDGTSLGDGLKAWIGRGTSKALASLAELQLGLSVARSLDSQMNIGLAGLTGDSLGMGIRTWIQRGATAAVAGLASLQLGLGVARQLNQQVLDGFSALSGESLGTGISFWIAKGAGAATRQLAGLQMGLGIARIVNQQVVDGFAALSGDSLGAAIKAWIERGTTAAMTSFTKFSDDVMRTMSLLTSKVDAEMGRMASAMTRGAEEARQGISKGFSAASKDVTKSIADITATVSKGMLSVGLRGGEGGRNFASNFGNAADRAVGVMRGIVSDISNAASGLAGSMRAKGSAAGAAFASGLESQVFRVEQAANRIVAAANRAASIKLQEGSPSKIWTNMGLNAGTSFANALASTASLAARAAEEVTGVMGDVMAFDSMAVTANAPSWLTTQAASPPHLAAAPAGSHGNTYNTNITAVQREGEDTMAFATRLAALIVGADEDASGG